ncbi:hypothetical protein B0J12DRAFT_697506 [Macrophomina phaseolina]|uniref:Uncharacterized protein n=1 Tax=Macrophomina phaseolina TaxID=35725 RepID=A0ABQ8GJJ4_9PEZI|nr:hypothetical protein B0J12DRAFT_697506 [Macrophomina phaseolina]
MEPWHSRTRHPPLPETPPDTTPLPPQPPTTPHTLPSSDPEVAAPPHGGPRPAYPSGEHEPHDESNKPIPSSTSSPPPLPPTSLRAEWLAARAPEYYQLPSAAAAAAAVEEGPEVYYHGGGEGWRGRKQRETVCGLRPGVFWVVVMALVLVFGGAIGGGVGGGLAAAAAAERDGKSLFEYYSLRPDARTDFALHFSSTTATSSSTASSTTTLNSSTSPTPIGQDSANCPYRTGQTYTTTNGSLTFLQLCGINICPETCDIVSASKQRLDTFEACMDACAAYNRQIGTQKCVAVTWDYQQVRQSFDKLCWLKLSQAPLVQDDPADGLSVGAVVIQS